MNKLLFKMIVIAFFLSTLDGVLTVIEVNMGWAEEANPLMKLFMDLHPMIFFVVKSLIAMIALNYLWQKRDIALARAGAFGSLILYSAIIGYHIHGISLL